jgi:hypothetical protein
LVHDLTPRVHDYSCSNSTMLLGTKVKVSLVLACELQNSAVYGD